MWLSYRALEREANNNTIIDEFKQILHDHIQYFKIILIFY